MRKSRSTDEQMVKILREADASPATMPPAMPGTVSPCRGSTPRSAAGRSLAGGNESGEVDMAAGTVTVTTAPSGGSSGTRLVLPTGTTTIMIANDGDPWNGVPSPTTACGGQNTTGANVAMTLGADAPSTRFFGALFARITDVSGTGTDACNSYGWVPSLEPNHGIWRYPSLGAIAPTPVPSASVEWDWVTSSATKFKFRGEVDGWIGTRYTAFAGGVNEQALSFTGTNLVFASGSSSRMSLVSLEGVEILLPQPESAPAPVKRVFADTVNGRIWFTAESGGDSWVGYTNLDGTGLRSVSLSSNSDIRALAVSTVPGARTAWVAEYVSGHVHSATIDDMGDVVPNTVFTYPDVGVLAYASDGNLWVAAVGGEEIRSFSTAGMSGTAWPMPDPEFVTDCGHPTYLIPGAPGTLYFPSQEGGMYSGGPVCRLNIAQGYFAQMGNVYKPSGLAIGPGGSRYAARKAAPNAVELLDQNAQPTAQVYQPADSSESLNAIVSVPGVRGGRNNAVWAVNGQGLYELQTEVAGSQFQENYVTLGYVDRTGTSYIAYTEQSIAFAGTQMVVNVGEDLPGPLPPYADMVAFVDGAGFASRIVPSQASLYPIGHFANSGSPTRVWYMHLGTEFASSRTTAGFFDATGSVWQEAVLYDGSTAGTDWKLFSPIAVRHSDENAAWATYTTYQTDTGSVVATGITRVDHQSDATPPAVSTFLELGFTSPGPGYQVRHAAPAGPDGRVLAYVVHLDGSGDQDGAEFRAYRANGSLQATKSVWGKTCGESAGNLSALGQLWYNPGPGTLWFEARDATLGEYEICALDLADLASGPDPQVVVGLAGGQLLQTANPYAVGPDGTPWIIDGTLNTYGPVTGGAGTGVYMAHASTWGTLTGITSGLGAVWTIQLEGSALFTYWW